MWRKWSRARRWLVILTGMLALLALVAAGALFILLRVPTLPLPEGVTKRTEKLALTGKFVPVDFYLPAGSGPAPVVIVAHGFARNRRTMAGWGGLLAQAGFLAVVPDQPSWVDHARNGRALAELLAVVQTGRLGLPSRSSRPAALVGFSAGGFSTLLAAAGNTNVSGWVGLDPVGMSGTAEVLAGSLSIPAFVLRAEPAPWNANGNARAIFAALPGPAFSLVVNGATHVDAENPTSRAAEWACGKTDPARRKLFGRYLVASLRTALLQDAAAQRELRNATNEPAVREVTFRKPESLRVVSPDQPAQAPEH